MADNDGFDGEHLGGGSFSQMLFSDDVVGPETECCFDYASSFSNSNPPKMLCFGGDYKNECHLGVAENSRTAQKSALTCSDSSSASSTNNTNANTLSKSNKKRNDSGSEPVRSLSAGAGAPAGSLKNCKKNKSDNSTLTGHAKVKKDQKLGERITTLQQLVSPFGKTDTASVLHEAMGYIRFLQDQVQVLCSPYLQRLPSSPHLQGGENGDVESRKDLKSRGLCLVPVECTVHLANNNGADFWSPAMANAASNH